MTSTATGAKGNSYGWLNDKLIAQGILPEEQAKGKIESKIYVFGSEERFWLGPEGGQYGIFFPKGAKFDFAVERKVRLLDSKEVAKSVGVTLPEGLSMMAYVETAKGTVCRRPHQCL